MEPYCFYLFFVIFDIGHFRFFLRLAINCRKIQAIKCISTAIGQRYFEVPAELYEMAIVISYNNLDFEMQNTQYNTWLININF